MCNRSEAVYFRDEDGNDFAFFQRYSAQQIGMWLAEGTIVEARMPAPTKKNQERYISVYKWSGIRLQKARDKSARMPGYVTEGAVLDNKYGYKMLVKAWKPQFAVVFA